MLFTLRTGSVVILRAIVQQKVLSLHDAILLQRQSVEQPTSPSPMCRSRRAPRVCGEDRPAAKRRRKSGLPGARLLFSKHEIVAFAVQRNEVQSKGLRSPLCGETDVRIAGPNVICRRYMASGLTVVTIDLTAVDAGVCQEHPARTTLLVDASSFAKTTRSARPLVRWVRFYDPVRFRHVIWRCTHGNAYPA
jgi:hypothetical protein